MWSIRILNGPQTGQVYDLKEGKNIFGRSANLNFKILSVGISKEHCCIDVFKDKYIITDLKSSNGTFLNGVKIQQAQLKLGDKISLFDVIMDVIPTTDIKPIHIPTVPPVIKNLSSTEQILAHQQSIIEAASKVPSPLFNPNNDNAFPSNSTLAMNGSLALKAQPISSDVSQTNSNSHLNVVHNYNVELDNSFKGQLNSLNQVNLQEKIVNYVDQIVMPMIYKMAYVFPFKQVLLGFVILFVFINAILSVMPMNTIIAESNLVEATKRAKSVARSLAKLNEKALLAGDHSILNVNEALKEDGIKEALIIQNTTGVVVAPPEKAGTDLIKSFVIKALRENRPYWQKIDSKTIGATYPVAAYDPVSGENSIKYHAIVYYDISSLNVDDNRILSLFLQYIVISGILGVILYFLFSRLISYPLTQLNIQIDTALKEKTDHTEVKFDDPDFQKIVSNVNLLLNRIWNGLSQSEVQKPHLNKELEMNNLLSVIKQPGLVLSKEKRIIACNSEFELLLQIEKNQLLQFDLTHLQDSSLIQNIEFLIQKTNDQVYEVHTDKIPFSQFECQLHCQAFLDLNNLPEFYFITLSKINPES